MRKPNSCAKCNFNVSDFSDKQVYETFNLCRKHSKELKPKENKMDCPVCGCQDTKFVTGIAKSGRNIGQPWSAYDCQNPQCKNEKGFSTRTFVKTQPGQAKFATKSKAPIGNLGPNISDIMKELKKMQEFMGMVNPDIEQVNKEMQGEANQDSSPF